METFSKIEAKEEIAKLVKKYENLTPNSFKTYNEANTRKDFILPLFRFLGWDVYNDFNSNEVIEEETTIAGRIDYSFRLNNITQFLLEAKAIPEDLDKEKWAKQTIEYGWNKGITWVVLTDFEGLKVFNCDWKVSHPQPCLHFSYKDYLTKFDRLWLLSKESSQVNELDKLLSEFGITAKRISINEKLAEDLVNWRNILTNNLRQWNNDIPLHNLEEAVQRILDRLIFIRVVEDKNFEEKFLWQTFKKWETGGRKSDNFIKVLTPLFRQFDQKYNSNLFRPHLCENLETEGTPFLEIIPQLYGEKEEGVKYRFDAINADVLGNVYEQYLGTVQQRLGTTSKRKKQGIYYTPSYIVDYIVQNTLGRLLKEKSSLSGKENLKILDPACGSGSFLIKAFEVLDNHLKQEKNQKTDNYIFSAIRRYGVLTNNIYGIDLDEQAIEIARLNLILKALVPKNKLPLLTDHMKVGNSLIDDNKITDKAFNWNKEFPEVFKGKNLGFDVIIGNPPYVGWSKSKQSRTEKDYYEKRFKEIYSGKNDLFYYFIQQSIELLKQGGKFSFIVSRYFLESIYAKKLRNYILKNTKIISIVDFREEKIFKEAGVHTCILVLEKNKNNKKNNIQIILNKLSTKSFSIPQKSLSNSDIWQLQELENSAIIQKIINMGKPITNYLDIKDTALSALDSVYIVDKEFVEIKKLEKPFLKKFINSKDIREPYYYEKPQKYFIHIGKKSDLSQYPKLNSYIQKNKELIYERNKKRKENLGLGLARSMMNYSWDQPKIFCPSRAQENRFIFDDNKMIGSRHNTTVLFNKSKVDVRYFVGLLNSKLFGFYFKIKSKKMGKSYEYLPEYLNKLFIRVDKEELIIEIVKQIIKFKKQVYTTIINSDKWYKLKGEIEKLDEQINKMVYKLYDLTDEEIKSVEEFV